MSKSLKISLTFLFLISVCFSLLILFGRWPFIKKETVSQSVKVEEQSIEQTPEVPSGFLVYPTEEKYVGRALIKLNKRFPHNLSFYLDSGEPIKAVFRGRIVDVRNFKKGEAPLTNETDHFQLSIKGISENEKLMANYFVIGDLLVKEGDFVEAGVTLAVVKQGTFVSIPSGNFSLSIFQEIKTGGYRALEWSPSMFILN